jgi:hypothetical protein
MQSGMVLLLLLSLFIAELLTCCIRRAVWHQEVPVFLCHWHVKRAWLTNVTTKCKKSTREALFHRISKVMAMVRENKESETIFVARIQTILNDMYREFQQEEAAFVRYFKTYWGDKIGLFACFLLCFSCFSKQCFLLCFSCFSKQLHISCDATQGYGCEECALWTMHGKTLLLFVRASTPA